METSFSLSLRIATDRRERATGGRERTTSWKENGRKREGTNPPFSSNMNPDALPSSLDPASVCTFPSLIPHTYISYIRILTNTWGFRIDVAILLTFKQLIHFRTRTPFLEHGQTLIF